VELYRKDMADPSSMFDTVDEIETDGRKPGWRKER
jgi:hypothetical protein